MDSLSAIRPRYQLAFQISLLGIALLSCGAALWFTANTSSLAGITRPRATAAASLLTVTPPVEQSERPVIPPPFLRKRIDLPRYKYAPGELNELIETVHPTELGKVDIARVNLLSATHLPGSEHLTPEGIDQALSILDRWAERVAFETDRHLYRLIDPQFADYYEHSEPKFRAEMLVQVLQEDLGVKYNLEADGHFSFADPSVAFLLGMVPAPGKKLSEVKGGTCVSMPVLYVAVGRRLGYPLNLVTTNAHVFVRWDGEASGVSGGHKNPAWQERFNIEGTGLGVNFYEDSYYKSWPIPATDAQIEANGWLKSLTPPQEFALFLASRGHHHQDLGQPLQAARCYENAHQLDPAKPAYHAWFMEMALRCDYEPRVARLHADVALAKAQRTTQQRRPPDPWTPQPGVVPTDWRVDPATGLPMHTRNKPIGQPTFPTAPTPPNHFSSFPQPPVTDPLSQGPRP